MSVKLIWDAHLQLFFCVANLWAGLLRTGSSKTRADKGKVGLITRKLFWFGAHPQARQGRGTWRGQQLHDYSA